MNAPESIFNERLGLLKAVLALIGIDFTGWSPLAFATELARRLPKRDRRKGNDQIILKWLQIAAKSDDAHTYYVSPLCYTVHFFVLRGDNSYGHIFQFTDGQSAILQNYFERPWKELITVFLSPSNDRDFDQSLNQLPNGLSTISALRRCDSMAYAELVAALALAQQAPAPSASTLEVVRKATKTKKGSMLVHDHRLTPGEIECLQQYAAERMKGIEFTGLGDLVENILFLFLELHTDCLLEPSGAVMIRSRDYRKLRKWMEDYCKLPTVVPVSVAEPSAA